jgi:hypothetical protein
MADVDVHRVEADAGAIGDEVLPRIASWSIYGRRNELEVVRAVVGEDQEPILLMVDGVFDPVTSSFE